MILPTFKGGLTYNGASATIDYLLNERVKEGLAIVIKGDPELTKRLIKEASKKQKWSWSSGVLSFSETLDDKTKREIIADFERVFFAGLSQEQFNILWVNHEDKGRTELHYVTPRLELTTGKAFNPYIKTRDFRKKDIFQEVTNLKYGLSSIIDSPQLLSAKPDRIWEKELDLGHSGTWRSVKKQIDAQLKTMVESGELENRNNVIDVLRNTGLELSDNVRGDGIVLLDKERKPHVFKGGFYREDFNEGLEDLREKLSERNTPVVKINGEYKRTREYKELEIALKEIVRKQSYGNRDTYGTGGEEKTSQIIDSLIKLESKSMKMSISKDTDNLAGQIAEEETNTKKEEDNDRIRTTLTRYDRERKKRERRRKRRIEYLVECNYWAKSTDYQFITEGFERWYRDKRFREDFEKGIRAIFGNLGGVKQKPTDRNKEILGILRLNSGNTKFEKLNENSNPDVVSQAKLRNAEARTRNKENKIDQGKKQTI